MVTPGTRQKRGDCARTVRKVRAAIRPVGSLSSFDFRLISSQDDGPLNRPCENLSNPPSSSSFSSVVLEISRKSRTRPSTMDEDEKLHGPFTQSVKAELPT